MTERVLVIAPHPDDEALGCGGAVCLHHRRGADVHIVFLTSGERGIPGAPEEVARSIREAEAEEASRVLKVGQIVFLRLPDLAVAHHIGPGAEQLGPIVREYRPQFVYLPHPDDGHVDHQACLPLVRAALAGQAELPELRLYEVWSPMATYDWAEDVTSCFLQKLRAVRCYRSQLTSFRYDRAVQGLNRYRGCLAARCRYAEVFRCASPASDRPA
jgi:LmbE family N-acetylglucosaminyl deacetylase